MQMNKAKGEKHDDGGADEEESTATLVHVQFSSDALGGSLLPIVRATTLLVQAPLFVQYACRYTQQ